MSGLNPFRPKKSEDLTAHRHQPHSSLPITPSPNNPDPIFLGHLSTPSVVTDQTNPPSRSASAGTTPPPTTSAPDLDDSATSDDQSTSDPFNQDADVSDYEVERARDSSEVPATDSLDVQQRHQGTTHTSPSPNQPSTETGQPGVQKLKTGNQAHTENGDELSEITATASSLPSRQMPASMGESDSDSTSNEPQPYTRSRKSNRPVSLGPGIDPNTLATRSGNRDRVPPPPPRSHHGKLISPGLSVTPPVSQSTPGKATSRVSVHGPSPGPLASPRMPQITPDYFGTPSSQPTAPADTLRRSQSQNKRPPTPPLSRRHSQMRRSKSTLSQPSSSRLSVSHSTVETAASTPSSPGSRSLTPSLRSRDSINDEMVPDESSPNLALQSENIAPSSLQSTEVPGLGTQPNPRTASKRASLINNLPPPPPPRRTRGSKHSNDNNRPASLRSEQRTDEPENFVSHPSNATDILADLSRLQKEVDDLRGHYENRRAQ